MLCKEMSRGRRGLAWCRGPIQADKEGKGLAFQILGPNNRSTIGIGKTAAMRVLGNNEA